MLSKLFIHLRPIPIRERNSILFLEYGQIDVLNQAFALTDANGVRTQIPIGGLACLMLEPGTRITHAAISLAARVGCLITWVGEGGVRLYSAGQPGGARADRLLYQAKIALDEAARLRVVQEMYRRRFGKNEGSRSRRSRNEDPPGYAIYSTTGDLNCRELASDFSVRVQHQRRLKLDHGKQIVVLSHGFVYVGDVSIDGEWCKIANASNVRRWGTSKGLGELAANGPLKQSVLDPAGTVQAPMSSVVALIACEAAKWS
jgi:hypothetical protein